MTAVEILFGKVAEGDERDVLGAEEFVCDIAYLRCGNLLDALKRLFDRDLAAECQFLPGCGGRPR